MKITVTLEGSDYLIQIHVRPYAEKDIYLWTLQSDENDHVSRKLDLILSPEEYHFLTILESGLILFKQYTSCKEYGTSVFL